MTAKLCFCLTWYTYFCTMKICHINFIRQIFKEFVYKERKIIQEEGKIRKVLVHIDLSIIIMTIMYALYILITYFILIFIWPISVSWVFGMYVFNTLNELMTRILLLHQFSNEETKDNQGLGWYWNPVNLTSETALNHCVFLSS